MAHNTDIATRAFVVTLKSPCSGKTTAQVSDITGLPKNTINYIYARAIARGFDPNQRPMVIKNCYVEDAPRNGRPTKRTQEMKKAAIAKVLHSPYGRKKTCAEIASELASEGMEISPTSVSRILKAAGFRKAKVTN